MVLDLDDSLRTHIPEAPVGLTIRDALAHLSGLQREPPGEIWESLTPPSREELLGGLEDAERVLRPGEAWHYSNLAYRPARRGRHAPLRGRLRGGAPVEGARAARARPDRVRPAGPARDRVLRRPVLGPRHGRARPGREGPTAAIGWLWSTVDDLARFGDFIATGRDGVLLRETVDEMARVRSMVDEARWSLGWGLGLGLYRRGERVYVGHGGAMPGFLAALCVHRPERTGAAVLVNTSAGAAPDTLALDLSEAALDALPRAPELWRPDDGVPEDVVPLLGRWWSEGSELALSWRGGRLRLEAFSYPEGRNVSWLTREEDDRWRIVDGRELGELLRVVRDGEGAVVKLYVATYPLTRAPATFGESASS